MAGLIDDMELNNYTVDGNAYVLDRYFVSYLEKEVEAENIWHLCSIAGLQECMARVLYRESNGDK
jgi:hypothetical protein